MHAIEAREIVLRKYPKAYLVFNIAGRSAIYTPEICLGHGTRPTPSYLAPENDDAWIDAAKNIGNNSPKRKEGQAMKIHVWIVSMVYGQELYVGAKKPKPLSDDYSCGFNENTLDICERDSAKLFGKLPLNEPKHFILEAKEVKP